MLRFRTGLALFLSIAGCGRIGLELAPQQDGGGADLPDVDTCGASGTTPITLDDSSCDGIDDDCDGAIDEGFVAFEAGCGVGACAARGTTTCEAGRPVPHCAPGQPLASTDDLTNIGVDDDCDGELDEDAPQCQAGEPLVFGPGAYPSIPVPAGCGHVTVRLWGGAGAAGEQTGVFAVRGGHGGAGGYAANTVPITETLKLYVGTGAPGCDAAGSVPGADSFGGGLGGVEQGDPGAGLTMGGRGGVPESGHRGGDGFYGGGGGGQGRGGLGESGVAGGGGAATAAVTGEKMIALAGGGGGGGGAQVVSILGAIYTAPGNAAGSGCAGLGSETEASGGGGGGGGTCVGATQMGSQSTLPVLAPELPAHTGVGGTASCESGGDGYAIVQFRL